MDNIGLLEMYIYSIIDEVKIFSLIWGTITTIISFIFIAASIFNHDLKDIEKRRMFNICILTLISGVFMLILSVLLPSKEDFLNLLRS